MDILQENHKLSDLLSVSARNMLQINQLYKYSKNKRDNTSHLVILIHVPLTRFHINTLTFKTKYFKNSHVCFCQNDRYSLQETSIDNFEFLNLD